MTMFDKIKPIVLTVLICAATLLRTAPADAAPLETLTVAGGCFWCVEADFEKVPGVAEVVSGFTGGQVADPSYKQVTAGGTGHYEAVQISFDPSIVTREKLLEMFLRSVDPTDASGQFCDRGDSYRTAIFVSDPGQKASAEAIKTEAQAELGKTIVTPILSEGPFFPADESHQDYYKSAKIILTRFGPKRRSEAYKLYRSACGRDERVRALWGASAPFAGS